jgi:hypothetical protein
MVLDEQTIPTRSGKRRAADGSPARRTNSCRRSRSARHVPYLGCSQVVRLRFGEGAGQSRETRLRWDGYNKQT